MKTDTTPIKYKAIGQSAFYMRDNYATGLDTDTTEGRHLTGYEYESDSLEELIKLLETKFGVTKKDMTLDIDASIGVVIITLYLKWYDISSPLYNEYHLLKDDYEAGKIDLAQVHVSIKIYAINMTPVNLEEIPELLD